MPSASTGSRRRAPRPITSTIGGVPASNFHGISLGVQPSRRTSRIISPPPRKGGMARAAPRGPTARRCRSGRSILWPVKPKKSQPSSVTSVGRWGTYLRAVDQAQRTGGVRGVGELADGCQRAEHVRHGRDSREQLRPVEQLVEVGEVERVVVGHRRIQRSSMPRSSCSISHGTRLAWCSISVSTTDVALVQVGPAPGVGDQVDRLGDVLGEDDARAGDGAPMNRATLPRAAS